MYLTMDEVRCSSSFSMKVMVWPSIGVPEVFPCPKSVAYSTVDENLINSDFITYFVSVCIPIRVHLL